MSRFHVHVAVPELDAGIRFYSALFGAGPAVHKQDYAKWELEDPKVNFAISTRGAAGLDHLGVQAESDEELAALRQRLDAAGLAGVAQEATTCCYARSDKYWVQDSAGLAWETFHTLDSAPTFNEAEEPAGEAACCAPAFSGCC